MGQPKNCLPKAQLQENYQPRSLPASQRAGYVSGHVCSLSRHVPVQHVEQRPGQVPTLQEGLQCGPGVCQDTVNHIPYLWTRGSGDRDRNYSWNCIHCCGEGRHVCRICWSISGCTTLITEKLLLLCDESQFNRRSNIILIQRFINKHGYESSLTDIFATL